jgi:hypothetical protein
VKAVARVATNSAVQALDLEVNGTLRAGNLGGPWTGVPLEVDLTPYATQASATDNRLYARLKNTGGGATTADLQLHVVVLR